MQRASLFGLVTVVVLTTGLLFASWSAQTSELGLDNRSDSAPHSQLPFVIDAFAKDPNGLPTPVPTASVDDGPGAEQVVKLEAKRFEYTPSQLTVKKGVPVVLELTTRDVEHGFSLPDFNVRTAAEPGKVSRVRFTPDQAGTFTFLCDVYCGSGHEEMSGTLVVTGE